MILALKCSGAIHDPPRQLVGAPMRVAIVGSGVAGLVCAHLLHPVDEVVVFEAEERVGGHVRTVTVKTEDGDVEVDCGFIVFNEQNYPGFTRLLERLGVASQPSVMSFSLACDASGLEYQGTNLNTVFSDRSNMLRPSFLSLLRDVPRFNRAARAIVEDDDVSTTLDAFIAANGFSRSFVDHYLVPLGASIWSADPTRFGEFPAASLARFFDRHGLLELGGRPRWRTVSGGAARYVDALVAPMHDRVRTGSRVVGIERDAGGVSLWAEGGPRERFDRVIFACHADQALAILGPAATRVERQLLSSFRYQPNQATLHTDTSLMPRRRRAWASWNYRHVTDEHHDHQAGRATITYYANELQALDLPVALLTTLNRDHAIDPAKVIERFTFAHPVFDEAAMLAQRRHEELLGANHTYYCGAYWGYGFHEDGLQSALRVLGHFGRAL